MPIPEGFIFSQGKLQDYLDCQRRFQLKYLLERSWPALEAQPAKDFERLKILGQRFHQIVRQFIIGIPELRITETIQNETLRTWWNNFLNQLGKFGELNILTIEDTQNYSEISISAPILNFQLIAKYDLISITRENQMIIFDWKTAKYQPKRDWLSIRMQTRIYPYLLAKAGNFLNSGNNINPDNIQIIYWYANHPDKIEKFNYSHEMHYSNEEYLIGLIDEINRNQDSDFSLTSNVIRCRYCVYRSLCVRGSEAGLLDELPYDAEMDNEMIDFAVEIEQIAEIDF